MKSHDTPFRWTVTCVRYDDIILQIDIIIIIIIMIYTLPVPNESCSTRGRRERRGQSRITPYRRCATSAIRIIFFSTRG